MKLGPSQDLRYGDYRELLAQVDALLFKLVYLPVVNLVRPTLPKIIRADLRDMQGETAEELRNAGDGALRRGLQDGGVNFVAGGKGKALFYVAKPDRRISDALKDFGCRLNKTLGAWECEAGQVPGWVRAEAATYNARSAAAHDAVKRLIDQLAGGLEAAVKEADLSKAIDHATSEVAKGWRDSAKAIEVKWNLGTEGQRELAKGFTAKAAIDIKSPGDVAMVEKVDADTKEHVLVWAQEALGRLREQVDENAQQGYRAEGLAQRIRDEYGVSKGRSELIARQETNNFMAAFRQARAADAGIHRYMWYAVMDSRTRPLHKALHKTLQRYDKPPVVDERSGARGNPGQIFRCRCTDRMVLE